MMQEQKILSGSSSSSKSRPSLQNARFAVPLRNGYGEASTSTILYRHESESHEGGTPSNHSRFSMLRRRPGANDQLSTSNSNVVGETEKTTCLQLYRRTLLITGGILVAAVVATTTTYFLLRSQEEDEFRSAFDSSSSKLAVNVERNLQLFVSAASSLAVSMTSEAAAHNETFPFMTLPHFIARIESLGLLVASAQGVFYAPFLIDQHTRLAWEAYATSAQFLLDVTPSCAGVPDPSCRTVDDGIYRIDQANASPVDEDGKGPYFPLWQVNGSERLVMWNLYSEDVYAEALTTMVYQNDQVLSDFLVYNGPIKEAAPVAGPHEPSTCLFHPVSSEVTVGVNESVVGTIGVDFTWSAVLGSTLPNHDITAVIQDAEKELSYSYQIGKDGALFLGEGDLHESTQGDRSRELKQGPYTIFLYPDRVFEEEHLTQQPGFVAMGMSIIFIVFGGIFWIYSYVTISWRTKETEETCRPSVIVSSGPKSFRRGRRPSTDMMEPANVRLRTYLTGNSNHDRSLASTASEHDQNSTGPPIADLFSEVTLLFADIAGFTAWSSEREPQQVFLLLETLYRSFDVVAGRLGVFKVETIGDSYVACTGLPDPSPDHAFIMVRFAYECLLEMNRLVRELETTMGPGTSDLALRIGIHSGSVTAGVLRGEKPRFQVFGESMNIAHRMEGTGQNNRIQLSEDTAGILISAGKASWVQPREGLITVNKGKTEMQTYWLMPGRMSSRDLYSADGKPTVTMGDSNRSSHVPKAISTRQIEKWGSLNLEDEALNAHKMARLVNWNVEVLLNLLSKVVAARLSREPRRRPARMPSLARSSRDESMSGSNSSHSTTSTKTAIDEVTEIITLPQFKGDSNNLVDSVPLSADVRHQMHEYVTAVSSLYRDTPFHNLEHASHVTLSATKLMKRIISPVEDDFRSESKPTEVASESRQNVKKRKSSDNLLDLDSLEKNLHDNTFGIASDPLTQFSIVFAALLHDVEHTGLPNAQLVKEECDVAKKYHNKSVAEQNSVDVSWGLLMEDRFEDLRMCIYNSPEELKRFRQLIVNSIMATDIVDKDLRQLRNSRWEKAFDESNPSSGTLTDINRKATIVIEHIIQASDVAHTMQHWHIYCKWNERLFQEMYIAYLTGHADKDPTIGWYGGEIWFFDNYIIPLARKLLDCGVFGVYGNEYLNYAIENRKEWERKGRDVCRDMIENFKIQYSEIYYESEKSPENLGTEA